MVYGPQRLLSGVKTPILTSSEHMIVLISKSTPSSEVCNENLSVREHSAFECTAQHPVEKVYIPHPLSYIIDEVKDTTLIMYTEDMWLPSIHECLLSKLI